MRPAYTMFGMLQSSITVYGLVPYIFGTIKCMGLSLGWKRMIYLWHINTFLLQNVY